MVYKFLVYKCYMNDFRDDAENPLFVLLAEN